MILRLTRTTAELVGETAAEWQLLEKQVRLGRWTSGPRAAEGRLRQLAAELGVPLRAEGFPVVRSRSQARARQDG
jgi:hypothetical protein